MASVTGADVERAVRDLGLAGQAVGLHASLRSFGWVKGGADAVVRGFLAAGCTLLVPAFTYRYQVPPPPGQQLARNAWPPEDDALQAPEPYTPAATDADPGVGAIPAAVARWPGRVRGLHPVDAFCAVGRLARELVDGQGPEDVYAPLRALAERGGSVVLAGVGLQRLTLIHLAEAMAGRELFRRWARVPEGTVRVAVGGCSEGFGGLEPALAPLMRRTRVGASPWIVLPAAEALDAAARAIRADPEVTRCTDHACERCRDAIAGGPILRPGQP